MRLLLAVAATLVLGLAAATPASAWVTFTDINGYAAQAEFVDPDITNGYD